MEPMVFDELQQALARDGVPAAIERLCTKLRERKDFTGLFYALLMKKRYELGVSPVATGSSQDLPAHTHTAYEEAIREACRLVGNLCLQEGNIPHAWAFFRMLGEPAPVAEALLNHQPGENDDVQQLVHIAFYEGANPRRGFDWIIERFGICNAITTLGSQDLGHSPEVRQYCIRRIVRSLYGELCERLRHAIASQEGKEPAWR